jgi:hypothetical protein
VGRGSFRHDRRARDRPRPSRGDRIEATFGDLKGHIVQGAVGYRCFGGNAWRVDAFAGARYYILDLGLDFRPGLLDATSTETDAEWVDAVIGVRIQGLLGKYWAPSLLADVGTGGPHRSWQGVASFGYRISWGELSAGWRYLKVKYETSDAKADLALSGPILGILFRF